jgi:hypothetical protein
MVGDTELEPVTSCVSGLVGYADMFYLRPDCGCVLGDLARHLFPIPKLPRFGIIGVIHYFSILSK